LALSGKKPIFATTEEKNKIMKRFLKLILAGFFKILSTIFLISLVFVGVIFLIIVIWPAAGLFILYLFYSFLDNLRLFFVD